MLLAALLLQGCGTLGFYSQAIAGHFSLMAKARPIEDVLRDPETTPDIRSTLETVLDMLRFAEKRLELPGNGSYSTYADVGRPYVVWNVFAAPALSLEPEQSCFLVVGCLNYRGYFREADALEFARSLKLEGLDVFVGGVTAYSTLGWFEDPLLNTMLRRGEPQLARVIFHELAHQRIYLPGDPEFNEGFADAVALTGVELWMAESAPGRFREFRRELQFEDRFVGLVLSYREKLHELYDSNESDRTKLQRKQEVFDELRDRHVELKRELNDPGTFDSFFGPDLNNASLLALSTYRELVPAFTRAWEAADRDFGMFYAFIETLMECNDDVRRERLREGHGAIDC